MGYPEIMVDNPENFRIVKKLDKEKKFVIIIFMGLKKCSKCGIDKELSEFNNLKSSSDGLNYCCRECCNIDKKIYRENNPDKVRESKKKYRENNPDKIIEYNNRGKVKKNKYSNVIWYYPTETFSFENIVKVKLSVKEKRIIYNKKIKLLRETLTESTCGKCGLTKPISEFYEGTITKCGECEKERMRIYRLEHPTKVKTTKKKWKDNNQETYKKSKKKHVKLRRQRDPFYRAICNLRTRTSSYLKQIGVKKDSSMFKIIGCTPDEFRKYLENRFLKGMSWDNYGIYGWHIDHIIPISLAKTLEDVKRLCHYTNFQPLWADDNLKKGNQMTPEGYLKEKFPYFEVSIDSENNVDIKVKPIPHFN